jgi:taurine transport system permease protein
VKVLKEIDKSNSIEVEARKIARQKAQLKIISLVSVVFVILLWECAVRFSWVNPKYVASPFQVISQFFTKLTNKNPDGATLPVHFLTSIKLVLIGFISAVLIGVPLGLFMGYYSYFFKFINPVFNILRPIPPIAWIPIAIVWFGLGTESKCFIIFLAAYIPCVINSYTGVRLTNPVLRNVSKTFGASRFKIFTTVCIPAAMPMTFTGIKIALSNAWTTLVAAELLAAQAGLGYMIQQGRTIGRSDIIIVGMLTIGIVGILLSKSLELLESKIIRWRKRS